MTEIESLLDNFFITRELTEKICLPLEIEDYVIQPIEDTSPPKWHLAHTSWFFENFILKKYSKNYKEFHPLYSAIFNSYYYSVGSQWPRAFRGMLSRPGVSEIYKYRNYITNRIVEFFKNDLQENSNNDALELLELGIEHEQQHQELLIMDIKYILGKGVIKSPYLIEQNTMTSNIPKNKFIAIKGGVVEIGSEKENHFSFCNEKPRHQFFLEDFNIHNRPISNEEYLNFIEDGGYDNPLLWKSDGWNYVQNSHDKNPLYWFQDKDGNWMEYTLYGVSPLRRHAPVSHINFFEADAFATWVGNRLLSEFEWEYVSQKIPQSNRGFFQMDELESKYFPHGESEFYSFRGNSWEWTSSAYLPYPKYKKPKGFLGEYNSKFMNGQMVLKGGSYGTLREHYRDTYRNFFYPTQKWAITGLRLAKDF